FADACRATAPTTAMPRRSSSWPTAPSSVWDRMSRGSSAPRSGDEHEDLSWRGARSGVSAAAQSCRTGAGEKAVRAGEGERRAGAVAAGGTSAEDVRRSCRSLRCLVPWTDGKGERVEHSAGAAAEGRSDSVPAVGGSEVQELQQGGPGTRKRER